MEDYCIIYITNTEKEAKDESEHYYLLCEKLPEDKEIRDILKKEKLVGQGYVYHTFFLLKIRFLK